MPLPPEEARQEGVANTLIAATPEQGVLLIQAPIVDVGLKPLLFGDLLRAGPEDLIRTAIAMGMLLIRVCSRYGQLVFLAKELEGTAAAGQRVFRLPPPPSLATILVIVIGRASLGLILAIAFYSAPVQRTGPDRIAHRCKPLRGPGALGCQATSVAIGMVCVVAVAGFGRSLLVDSTPGPVIACLWVPLLQGSAVARHRGCLNDDCQVLNIADCPVRERSSTTSSVPARSSPSPASNHCLLSVQSSRPGVGWRIANHPAHTRYEFA